MKIKHRYTAKILFEKDNVDSIKELISFALSSNADLQGAYLQGAELQGAYLQGADLQGAYLQGADLQGADLQGADLQGAYLQGAYLQGAELQGAYLQGADLRDADLRGAYLRDADLQGAYLQGAVGNLAEIKSIFIEKWPITYTHDTMQIGCERHSIDEWFKFDDEAILEMDGNALEWWKKWKNIIKSIIDTSPAIKTREN